MLKALYGRLLSRPFLAQIAENYPFGAKNCVFGPKVQFLETSSKKNSGAKLSTPKSPFLPNFNYFLGWNQFWTHYTVIRCRFRLNTLFSETPCMFTGQFSIFYFSAQYYQIFFCGILENDLLVGLLRHRNADRMCIVHGLTNVISATILHILYCIYFIGYLVLGCFLFIDGTSSCLVYFILCIQYTV